MMVRLGQSQFSNEHIGWKMLTCIRRVSFRKPTLGKQGSPNLPLYRHLIKKLDAMLNPCFAFYNFACTLKKCWYNLD